MNVRILRLCGFFGMLTPIVGFTMIFLAISQAPWFSWTLNALSDLGIDGFEAVFFNSGLPMTGAVMMMFSAGLFELTRGSTIGMTGSAVNLASAILLILIGVVNETIKPWHYIVSFAFFATLAVMLVIMGAYHWRANMRSFAILAWSVAALGIVIWMLPWGGVAIPEALSALCASVWQVSLGYWMYTLREEGGGLEGSTAHARAHSRREEPRKRSENTGGKAGGPHLMVMKKMFPTF